MPAAHVADGSMHCHWGVHGVPRPVPVILCELCVLILPTTNPKYGIDPLPAPRTKDRGDIFHDDGSDEGGRFYRQGVVRPRA